MPRAVTSSLETGSPPGLPTSGWANRSPASRRRRRNPRRPATIRADVKVDLPRPRDLHASAYIQARDQIFAAMGMNPHTGDTSGEPL